MDALAAPRIDVAHNAKGYDDISTVYAYYTPEQKGAHGKHCEWWTAFSNHYPTGKEREFIAGIEAERPGQFASYLISWSGCE
jgi:hypothetical protein